MKNFCVATFLLLLLSMQAFFQTKFRDADRWLVFEANVNRIGSKPGVLCGVVSPYRLAEYRVKKVYLGSYKQESIVVDHLFCSENVLSDVQINDTVIVIVDLFHLPAERWYDGVIRTQNEKPKKIYVAHKVGKILTCCGL